MLRILPHVRQYAIEVNDFNNTFLYLTYDAQGPQSLSKSHNIEFEIIVLSLDCNREKSLINNRLFLTILLW